MADRPASDSGAESPAGAEGLRPEHGADPAAVRRRAYELSQLHPDATAEANWLRAERELLDAASEHDRRESEGDVAGDTANLMAKIEMAVWGHP
jgi:hypothetical protein